MGHFVFEGRFLDIKERESSIWYLILIRSLSVGRPGAGEKSYPYIADAGIPIYRKGKDEDQEHTSLLDVPGG
jgi:hypothetical protein